MFNIPYFELSYHVVEFFKMKNICAWPLLLSFTLIAVLGWRPRQLCANWTNFYYKSMYGIRNPKLLYTAAVLGWRPRHVRQPRTEKQGRQPRQKKGAPTTDKKYLAVSVTIIYFTKK